MIQHLIKYFSINGQLALPGIGSLKAENKTAQIEFVEKTLHAPELQISFSSIDTGHEKMISFLSREMNVSADDAAKRFKLFIQHLLNKLQSELNFPLPGLGTISKNNEGYQFSTDNILNEFYNDIPAEKVIRQNVQHTVRVGEDEKTSAEMQQILNAAIAQDKWWIGAIVLSVIGIGAILYYYLTRK